MTMSKLTPPTVRKTIVIKLGGSTLSHLTDEFFLNFKAMQNQYNIIITHGGGPAINEALANQRVHSHTIDGVRVTSKQAINVIQNTLIGQVNPSLVHALTKAGIAAVGLNGFDNQLVKANFLDEELYGFVGEVTQVNTAFLNQLLAVDFVPVIACIGAYEGQAMNINGDTMASEIALAIGAESLLLVTDVDGIRINKVYQQEATEKKINEWIATGDIYGGMIPKVQGALQCLQAGIPSVHIVGANLTGTKIKGE